MNESMKQENKSALRKFILFILLGAVIGGFMGFFGEQVKGVRLTSLLQKTNNWLLTYSPQLLIASIIVFPPISLILYGQCKSRYRRGDISDEELDSIEFRLNIPLLLSSLHMIISFFLFGCIFVNRNSMTSPITGLGVLAFIISLFLIILVQKLVIDFEKKINPEKRGSVFDTKFAKIWEQSCDEAERLMIYKSAYRSYQTTNTFCIFLWLVLLLSNIVYQSGILPILIVTLIWLVQTISYMSAAMKLEQLGLNQKKSN